MKMCKILSSVFAIFALSTFIRADENFIWNAERKGDEIIVSVKIPENFYLYSDVTKVSAESADKKNLVLKNAPKAEKYIDEFRQENIIYKSGEHRWIFDVSGAMPFTVRIRYQGCSKKPFLCYPPAEKTFNLDDGFLKSALDAGSEKLKKVSDMKITGEEASQKIAPEDSFIGRLSSRGGWWIFLAAFAAGILSTLTPCVLPLIPITVAILSGGDKEKGGFLKALVYVIGIIIMFTVLAAVAAFSGKAFGAQILGNRIAVLIFGIIFFALSLSMLGLYDLQLPSSLQTKLSNIGGGGFIGAFLMGLVAGLIAVPCTGPVLGALLGIAAASANPVFSVALLFSYACGFGAPFLLISTGAKVLPKKGGSFMEAVKSLLGIAIMAIAIFAFTIALPSLNEFAMSPPPYAKVMSLLFIIAGFLMGAVHSDGHSPNIAVRIAKIAGAVLIASGLIWNLKLENGKADTGIKWMQYGDELFAKAGKENKMILLDFTAEWCAACKEMDATTFKNAKVIDEISSHWLPAKIDCTFNTPDVQEKIKRYSVRGFPGFVILSPKGEMKESFTGYHSAEDFLRKLSQAKQKK